LNFGPKKFFFSVLENVTWLGNGAIFRSLSLNHFDCIINWISRFFQTREFLSAEFLFGILKNRKNRKKTLNRNVPGNSGVTTI